MTDLFPTLLSSDDIYLFNEGRALRRRFGLLERLICQMTDDPTVGWPRTSAS
jgi:hypothetical protein